MKTHLIPFWKFIYGFDCIQSQFQTWLSLIRYEIPREILKECQQSGLLDFEGCVLHGSFFDYLGRSHSQKVTNKYGKTILAKNFNEALDYVFGNISDFETKEYDIVVDTI